MRNDLPKVSVVLPVKNRQGSIREAVRSLLDQDYPGLVEVLVVGDTNDQTWAALKGFTHPNLRLIGVDAPVSRRDANFKRNVGAIEGQEVLAFTDSDGTVPKSWIRTGVDRLLQAMARDARTQAVAGLIDSVGTGFWARYVDKNVFGAKLPRFREEYLTTAATFGQGGRKPPASGNLFVTRDAFMAAHGFDELQSRYEDYSFAWRLCRAGYQILHTTATEMIVSHYPRSGRKLIREYFHAGNGCGQFIDRCFDSPLATVRQRQSYMWLAGVATALITLLFVPLTPTPFLLASGSATTGLLSLGVVEATRLRRLEAVVYPSLTLFMGSVFTLGIVRYKDLKEPEINLVERSTGAPMNTPVRPAQARHQTAAPPWKRGWVVPTLILVLAAALRFWQIGSKLGWEWDETSYERIGQNVASHGTIQAVTEYGHTPVTFLFHPPFYFLLLGNWFKIVGAGITQARVLSATMALGALVLVYLLVKQLAKRKVALWTFAFLAIDPWMVYANRTSWMENTLIVLLVGAMLLYWRAIQRSTTSAFVLAGIGIGAAIVFKHTAVYLMLAVIVYWIVTRTQIKKHVILTLSTIGIVGLYLIGMSIAYGGTYWRTDLHQFLRAIGANSVNMVGNGSIRGLSGLVGPVFGQYRVFAATLIVATIACIWWFVRIMQCVIRRSFDPVRQGNVFAFAWMTGGVLTFVAIQLKYPSYFEVILIPMYVYLATEVKRVLQTNNRPKVEVRRFATIVASVLVLLCLVGLYARIVNRHDNALRTTGKYVAEHVPTDAVVLTEQSIGNMISQPFCDIRTHVEQCEGVASYVIVYTTANYPGPDNAQLRKLLARSTRVWTTSGFKEETAVYRIN